MISSQSISTLVDYHINDIESKDRLWKISESVLSGRGVFSSRDIHPGEIIFREKPLLIGPTGSRGIMNHQCTPNTCHSFEGDNVIVVRSTKLIPKGAELTTTYTRILWSNLSRNLFLNMTKQFSCSCKRCIDPTENGSYISALLCRTNNCLGSVIPFNCDLMISDWQCIKCGTTYDSKYISKIQDFILRIVNSKTSTCSVKEMLDFIREKSSRLCPPSNQFIIELKLHIIWKMTKSGEKFGENDYRDKIQYCQDILNILDKLEAGECTMKFLLLDEIKKVNVAIEKLK